MGRVGGGWCGGDIWGGEMEAGVEELDRGGGGWCGGDRLGLVGRGGGVRLKCYQPCQCSQGY